MLFKGSLQRIGRHSTLLMIPVMMVLLAGTGHAALSCNGCHGMPPLDSGGGRDGTTGAFEGNHITHGTSSQTSCIPCHGAAISNYSSSHARDRIAMASRIAGYSGASGAARYRNGIVFNQTTFPVLGTCTNTNCHFEATTPTWGAAYFSSPADCNRCHGAPPSSGSHPAHVTYYGAGTLSCVKCHSDYTAEAKPFAHATSAGKRGLKIQFTASPNTGGTYDGNVSYPAYLPSNNPARNGTCSNLYCHSNGKASPTYADRTWGGGSLSCKGCHGTDSGFTSIAGEPNYANTGGTPNSHEKHVGGLGFANTTRCAYCHNGTVDATIPDKLNNSALHLNGSRNIGIKLTGGKTGSYDAGSKSCSATYCHGDSTSPEWGNPTVCNDCHSSTGTSTGSKVNNWAAQSAHRIHWEDSTLPTTLNTPPGNSLGNANTYRFACRSCHFENASIHGLGPHTADRAAGVFFGYTTGGAVGTYSPGGSAAGSDNGFTWTAGTCAGNYCHSNGQGKPGRKDNELLWSQTTRTAGNCDFCHGNDRESDWRKSAPLYASESDSYRGALKGNAHDKHITKGATVLPSNIQCYSCHGATTRDNTSVYDKQKHMSKTYNIFSYAQGLYSSAFRDGDYTQDRTSVTVDYSYNPAGSSCSNVSCHPIGIDLATGQSLTRENSTLQWNGRNQCTNCHNMNMQDTSTFHHAMRNYSAGYPTASPNGDATSGANAVSRRCTMCHVDHNLFSPDLNTASGGRAYNMRTDIATTPNAAGGFTNTDFVKSGAGGICISCHYQAKTKDTTRRRVDAGTTVTPVITMNNFSGSAHQYEVPAKYFSDGSSSFGNCAKCHNALQGETSVFMNVSTAAGSLGLSFGNHNSGIRRLQGTLGASGGETAEEQICYRCHSHTTDYDPGGGPPKAIDGKDYYGVAPMRASAEEIFTANKYYRVANPTYSTTNRLYFKPSAGDAGYPAVPMPDAPANDGDLGDTFAGGTYIIRSMSPWATATSYETKSQTTNQTGTRFWKMAKFVSPAVYSNTTVPAGTWNISLYSRENSSYQNARVRYTVYKWTTGDAKGSTIITKGTISSELGTTSAPGAIRQVSISVPATSLTVGDKIVVDLALQTTTSSSTSSYSASYYFGNRAPSSLTLPGNVSFSYADPGTPQVYGHAPAIYQGTHRPSPADETRAYIAANKHIECNDCHNVHQTRYGLHTAGNPALAKVLTGVSGVSVTTWGANWAGVTTYNPSSTTAPLVTATAEWQICFKCHSGANAGNTSWGGAGAAAWTDLALEFNPNNESGHPVITSLNSYANSNAPKALLASQMRAPWTNVGNQVMTCSDCHASDSAIAKGPHGSSTKWMLAGTNKNWPYTTSAGNGTSSGTLATMNTTSSTTFCENCHVTSAAGHNAAGSWTGQTSTHLGRACVSCHIRVPHGAKTARLMTGAAAPARYKPDGNGGGTLYLEGITKWSSTPAKSNCYSTNGSCSSDHGTAGSTLRW